MSDTFAERTTHHPPVSIPRRMAACMWRQAQHAPRCPDTPRLDGRTALVTGGGRGIGLETSRGLSARGARVISASRSVPAPVSGADAPSPGPDHFLRLDLGDLASLPPFLDALAEILAGSRLDLLVANAGLWPTRHRRSAQGHEMAFATNVLGHHALVQGARERGLLAESARVVVLTGDIYVMARACTPDFPYRTPLGGQLAYCRSKLGNLWLVTELARRHPELCALAVHPGVIASDLGGAATGLVGAAKRALMLDVERGAQTTLFCATQPGLTSGAYYHNVLGRVELAPDDPASDAASARALWERLETLR